MDERDVNHENSFETKRLGALLSLLDLTARIVEHLHVRKSSHVDHLSMAGYENELKNWYHSLPQVLSWQPNNIENAPLTFFHLQCV